MPTKIFVGNVAVNTARESMLQLFQRYGCVTECDVLGNYAFVVSIDVCILISSIVICYICLATVILFFIVLFIRVN